MADIMGEGADMGYSKAGLLVKPFFLNQARMGEFV